MNLLYVRALENYREMQTLAQGRQEYRTSPVNWSKPFANVAGLEPLLSIAFMDLLQGLLVWYGAKMEQIIGGMVIRQLYYANAVKVLLQCRPILYQNVKTAGQY